MNRSGFQVVFHALFAWAVVGAFAVVGVDHSTLRAILARAQVGCAPPEAAGLLQQQWALASS